ncbi:MAG: antibiotic biosynthesis monooxygenase [Thiomonas sp. 20-64-9]|jgi:heme-degrading monooxygenase HmoA|uniref:antibiotic biosynthesis monooxygenase family protein n=1 Tax=unclassified Thiomonas TaxID=2625466 RepID=UPI000BD69FA6|nr:MULTISPECIES: antibiotic biosynthesis monooxygenase family protein [unclassified Thiomonas]OYV28724.1 MAG: antibiotic biosynthesis monooxygenase [Thiomonas sp. 20-64-9]OZB71458.1 MAG: antibiotic biosynthesis monooxygenase [Thiomonas sp. 13-64-67]
MIHELADIQIRPGSQAEFEAAIVHGVNTVISHAKGFEGYEIRKGIETPERYLLMIRWATLEDHTVGFRQSEAFSQWRAIVGPYFAQPPVVEHFTTLPEAQKH